MSPWGSRDSGAGCWASDEGTPGAARAASGGARPPGGGRVRVPTTAVWTLSQHPLLIQEGDRALGKRAAITLEGRARRSEAKSFGPSARIREEGGAAEPDAAVSRSFRRPAPGGGAPSRIRRPLGPCSPGRLTAREQGRPGGRRPYRFILKPPETQTVGVKHKLFFLSLKGSRWMGLVPLVPGQYH